jgi:hypothetical protein
MAEIAVGQSLPPLSWQGRQRLLKRKRINQMGCVIGGEVVGPDQTRVRINPFLLLILAGVILHLLAGPDSPPKVGPCESNSTVLKGR